MGTSIVQASGRPVGESGWTTIGQGAQGLAGLIGSLIQAQAANKKAQGQATLNAAGYKPSSGGSMDGYRLPALRSPSVEYVESVMPQDDVSVGPGSKLPNLMNSLQGTGVAKTFSPLQTMMTRNFSPSMFSYGGL